MKASYVSHSLSSDGEELALTDPVLFPPGLIDKVRKNKSSSLMGGSFGRHGDQNDDKGDERRIECRVGNGREKFAVAIEDEGECIHHLITHEHVPRFVRTAQR